MLYFKYDAIDRVSSGLSSRNGRSSLVVKKLCYIMTVQDHRHLWWMVKRYCRFNGIWCLFRLFWKLLELSIMRRYIIIFFSFSLIKTGPENGEWSPPKDGKRSSNKTESIYIVGWPLLFIEIKKIKNIKNWSNDFLLNPIRYMILCGMLT